MAILQYIDGFVLLSISLALLSIGQAEQRWQYRIPIFLLVAVDFALGISKLGSFRLEVYAPWIKLRVLCDALTFVVFCGSMAVHHIHEKRISRGHHHGKSQGSTLPLVHLNPGHKTGRGLFP